MATKAKINNDNSHEELKWPFGPKNYIFFAVAMAVIVAGFVALSKGDITFAPILLVIGYCVLIPISLWINGAEDNSPEIESDGE